MIVHPTYIDDLLQALLACIDRNDVGGRVFNVAGASALSLDEWAAAVASAMGTRLRQVAAPGDAARALAAGCAAVLRAFRVAPPHRLARLSRPVVSRALNIDQARQVLGLEPMTLEAALRKTVDSALSQGTLSNLVTVQN
jgi:nucleoside-diphosphate-sugar epimerase